MSKYLQLISDRDVLANSADPDQTADSSGSSFDLYCLLISQQFIDTSPDN